MLSLMGLNATMQHGTFAMHKLFPNRGTSFFTEPLASLVFICVNVIVIPIAVTFPIVIGISIAIHFQGRPPEAEDLLESIPEVRASTVN